MTKEQSFFGSVPSKVSGSQVFAHEEDVDSEVSWEQIDLASIARALAKLGESTLSKGFCS